MPISSEARATVASPHACQRYALRVGELTVEVVSTSPALRLQIPDVYRPFLAGDHAPDLSLRVRWGTPESDPAGALLFDSGATWRLYESLGQSSYRFHDASLGPAPYKEARLDPGLGEGEVILDPLAFSPDDPVDPLEFPLDELLFLRLLAARGGVELHACGVVAPPGQGYLFAGQSGDGKTTTARLWQGMPGARVLSDDRIIVRRRPDGRFWMYGTPWHGEAELAANTGAPLRAIFLPERGAQNAFAVVEPAAAVSSLLARSFVPFHDSAQMASALQVLEGLAHEVPCSRFQFVPGEAAVRFVLDHTP